MNDDFETATVEAPEQAAQVTGVRRHRSTLPGPLIRRGIRWIKSGARPVQVVSGGRERSLLGIPCTSAHCAVSVNWIDGCSARVRRATTCGGADRH